MNIGSDIICITHTFPPTLTYGKSYNVLGIDTNNSRVVIMNDINKIQVVSDKFFITLDKYRDSVLSEIGI